MSDNWESLVSLIQNYSVDDWDAAYGKLAERCGVMMVDRSVFYDTISSAVEVLAFGYIQCEGRLKIAANKLNNREALKLIRKSVFAWVGMMSEEPQWKSDETLDQEVLDDIFRLSNRLLTGAGIKNIQIGRGTTRWFVSIHDAVACGYEAKGATVREAAITLRDQLREHLERRLKLDADALGMT